MLEYKIERFLFTPAQKPHPIGEQFVFFKSSKIDKPEIFIGVRIRGNGEEIKDFYLLTLNFHYGSTLHLFCGHATNIKGNQVISLVLPTDPFVTIWDFRIFQRSGNFLF